MTAGVATRLNDRITITPILVPHRDEFSETAGFIITGPEKTILFIPDIDKWEKFPAITSLISGCDIALLDGTFFDGEELPGRDMREIPHPFIVESMAHFHHLPDNDKSKICFIHFNHTNPLLVPGSNETIVVREAGFCIAERKMIFKI